MSFKDALLALCVIIIWGLNFIAMKLGLDDMPPFLLGGLRFLLVFFPAMFFVPLPKIGFKWLTAYGFASFGQFALLFYAISLDMPSGVASLVLQSQVLFTVLLGVIFFKEHLQSNQIIGICVAILGMILLIKASMGDAAVSIPIIGFLLTLFAALSWGLGNIVNKIILSNPKAKVTALSLVVWGASITMGSFFLCSWLFEDHTVIIDSLRNIQLKMILVIFYLAFLSSIVGYGLWGYLLSRYATWRIAPLTLLVPIIGLASGALIFNEKLSLLQIIAILLVMTGLLINVFGGWLSARLRSVYCSRK